MVSHIRKLTLEFDLEFDFLGYELFPEDMAWPEDSPALVKTNRPKTPSRFQLAADAEGVHYPKIDRPHQMRTHNAHEAVSYAKRQGVGWEMVSRLYEAYWLRGQDINSVEVILRLADGLIAEPEKLRKAIEGRSFAFEIVGFDDAAYASGVYNVPTYWIGGERYAEQTLRTLRLAIQDSLQPNVAVPYADLHFPTSEANRPYTVINMVTTIDGKIISGDRDEHVMDLGSKTDHAAMRNIERACDGVILGATTLRGTPGLHYPEHLARFVLTESGKLDFSSRFFTDFPEKAYVITAKNSEFSVPNGIKVLRFGKKEINLVDCLDYIRNVLGVKNLLIEGGSEVNAAFLSEDLVDELFLTLAPKVKLGKKTPTYAGGEALPRDKVQDYNLVSALPVGDEVFLRYRRKIGSVGQ